MMYTATDFRKLRSLRKRNETLRFKNAIKKFLFFSFIMVFGIISAFFITSIAGASYTDVIIYQVNAGETLWSIAAGYNPEGSDIREFIFHIKKINQLETSLIQSGQEIKIPILK